MQLTRLQGGSPSKAKALIPQNKKLIDTTSSIVAAANSLTASIKLSSNFNFTPPLPLIGSLRPLYGAFLYLSSIISVNTSCCVSLAKPVA